MKNSNSDLQIVSELELQEKHFQCEAPASVAADDNAPFSQEHELIRNDIENTVWVEIRTAVV